jgi:hypothetical protein
MSTLTRQIGNESIKMTFHLPDLTDGYYRGTRFDHSGVFKSIEYDGCNYAEEWFSEYDPYKHDAVCGPTEEFSAIGFDEAGPGETFLKIGVGMLERIDGNSYDRFLLHKVVEPGSWTIESSDDEITFIHELKYGGYGYIYRKTVKLNGNGFRISHRLENTGSLTIEGNVYNHNFFTMGRHLVGPDRELQFKFKPTGDWREPYTHIHLEDGRIRFSEEQGTARTTFMGNLRDAENPSSEYDFLLVEKQNGRSVRMTSKKKFTHAVYWSNHRIACIEPYLEFKLETGDSYSFDIDYTLQ